MQKIYKIYKKDEVKDSKLGAGAKTQTLARQVLKNGMSHGHVIQDFAWISRVFTVPKSPYYNVRLVVISHEIIE